MLTQLSRGLAIEAKGGSSPSLFTRLRQHYAKRAARRQLQALDDRMLSDIGITRSDIDRVTLG